MLSTAITAEEEFNFDTDKIMRLARAQNGGDRMMETPGLTLRLPQPVMDAVRRHAGIRTVAAMARILISEALACRGEGYLDPEITPKGWPKGVKRSGRRGPHTATCPEGRGE